MLKLKFDVMIIRKWHNVEYTEPPIQTINLSNLLKHPDV